MKIEQIKVTIQYLEDLLATASGDPKIQEGFISSKIAEFKGGQSADEAAAKIAEELSTSSVEEQIEKASTIFHHDEAGIFLYDYMFRGFIKETVATLIELGEVKKLNPWNYRKACDKSITVYPRRVYFQRNGGGNITTPDGSLQRPLRAATMRGERVALARSEFVKAGAEQSFEIKLLVTQNPKSPWTEINRDLIQTCLNLGVYSGIGQWRSGGQGRFTVTKFE